MIAKIMPVSALCELWTVWFAILWCDAIANRFFVARSVKNPNLKTTGW
jgi:hypothetical protein